MSKTILSLHSRLKCQRHNWYELLIGVERRNVQSNFVEFKFNSTEMSTAKIILTNIKVLDWKCTTLDGSELVEMFHATIC